MIKMTHGSPPRTGGAAAFLGRADLILAITLRLAHPAPARNIVPNESQIARTRNVNMKESIYVNSRSGS